ncbi:MAG TPA: VWA domain-containing protein, partial [Acidimicrobiales bacterium]|nr:VWA domain-containing protein [Acidimicrobiales bacterium]
MPTAPPAAPPVAPPDRIVVGFARALRGAGLAVPVGSVVAFRQALAAVGLDRRDRVYWAGRATLVRRPEDAAVYDRVFASYWLSRPTVLPPPPDAPDVTLAVDDGPEPPVAGDGDADGPPPVVVRYSAVETLRDKDFSSYTLAEWAEFQRLLGRLALTTERRRARRRRPDRRHRGHPDLRRTVRRALRTGGEPLSRAWRNPATRPRRLVLLVDVSGSMEAYARALLRFAHAAVTARGPTRCEVFTLGTRLTR